MENSSWSLEKAKKFINDFVKDNSDYYMIITNKETQQEGCAIITRDKKIAVFEGNRDGSEDKVYSEKDFKQKYNIKNIYVEPSEVTIEKLKTNPCNLEQKKKVKRVKEAR